MSDPIWIEEHEVLALHKKRLLRIGCASTSLCLDVPAACLLNSC